MTSDRDRFDQIPKNSGRERISNTNLLLIITICTFVGMYVLAMLIWGGGFVNPQQFIDIFNNNAFLIVIACGLTVVMISGGAKSKRNSKDEGIKKG